MKKKHLLLLGTMLLASVAFSQQTPLTESYFVNKYALSPSYAGNSENGYLFTSYLQYWSGISDAPHTLRLSYHQGFKEKKVGLGANIIMDKAGAFQTFYGKATYSYRLKINTDEAIFFGLSAGIIKSSVNFSQFMSDPVYNSDPSLSANDFISKAKFVSDISAVYAQKNFQFGVLLSNINFGKNYANESLARYSPFLIYQIHAFYTVAVNDQWKMKSLAIFRAGKYMRNQIEIGAQMKYNDLFWGTFAFRGENVFSAGFGINVNKSLLINYSYNFNVGNNFNALQIHEVTLG